MKKKLAPIFALFIFGLLVSIVYATTFSSTYDTNTPLGSDDPAEADDRMREIKSAVQERENVDHYWPLTGTEVSDPDTGEHRKVLFHEPISSPGTIAENHGQVYMKDVNSIAELHWMDEDENEIQLTSEGTIPLTSGRLPNDTFLKSINFAGTGTVDLIKADINDTSVLPDGAEMVTSAAPTTDAMIVNKKYVDDSVATDDVPGAVFGVSSESTTFSNGMTIKTGQTAALTNLTNNTITFDAAFSTAIVSVVITPIRDADVAQSGGHVKTKSTTNFVIRAGSQNSFAYGWIAIGY